MEINSPSENSKEQLLSGNEQFEQWSKEHLTLQQQIELIEQRPHIIQADELEEQRLKKLKLQLKRSDERYAVRPPRSIARPF